MGQTAANTTPRVSHEERELSIWLKAAEQGRRAPRDQHPADELFAEHQLARIVIEVIEIESLRVLRGSLPSPVWHDIVEFIGNFMHQCHRRKEELALFPTITGALPRIVGLRFEHRRAERSTLELIHAIEEGDWERILRVASAYTSTMRRHMEHEEQEVFAVARAALSPAKLHEMRAGFDAIETKALRRGRAYYISLVRKMCTNAGIDPAQRGLG